MTLLSLLCAVGVLVAGCNGGSPAVRANKTRQAVIVLWKPGSAACSVKTFPSSLPMNKNDKVRWEIFDTDQCIDPKGPDVMIAFDKGDGDPTVATCNKSNKKFVECDLKDPAALEAKAYKYSVKFIDFKEDPEIQIEP